MENSKYFIFAIAIVITGIVLILVNNLSVPSSKSPQAPSGSNLTTNLNNMKITSPSFENNGNIPLKFTCDGGNMNPPLSIDGVPEDTMSLVLIMHDPDAPVSGGFTHWVIFNMSPETREIKEGTKPPSGIEGTNSGGKIGWTSPCPPSGIHHYYFTLYALDETLKFDSATKKADVEKAIAGHILEQAELVGLYQR